MTSLSLRNKKRSLGYLPPLACMFILLLMLAFSDSVKDGAALGIDLSLHNIIPTLFPFFILSDLWADYINIDHKSIPGRIFEKMFGISGAALPAFLLGCVSGFPLGISTATKYYENKFITKDELERISAISNNPSAAFVVSGIGAGLYGDVSLGILLYLTTVISAIIVGVIFKNVTYKSKIMGVIPGQSFNLVDSIKKAGLSSITVASYIIFFSSLIGLIRVVIKERISLAIISSILEITNACSLCAEIGESHSLLGLIITSFALSFSGFSVHLQAFAILPNEVSRGKYLLMKLIQGIISPCLIILPLLINR